MNESQPRQLIADAIRQLTEAGKTPRYIYMNQHMFDWCGSDVANFDLEIVIRHNAPNDTLYIAQDAIAPTCPDCGATMREWGRGATARKHGIRWVCPVAESEVTKDERGHLHRCANAKHTTTRVWTEGELSQHL